MAYEAARDALAALRANATDSNATALVNGCAEFSATEPLRAFTMIKAGLFAVQSSGGAVTKLTLVSGLAAIPGFDVAGAIAELAADVGAQISPLQERVLVAEESATQAHRLTTIANDARAEAEAEAEALRARVTGLELQVAQLQGTLDALSAGAPS